MLTLSGAPFGAAQFTEVASGRAGSETCSAFVTDGPPPSTRMDETDGLVWRYRT